MLLNNELNILVYRNKIIDILAAYTVTLCPVTFSYNFKLEQIIHSKIIGIHKILEFILT